jgi:4-amino-4-deoxy-L-arabinose transferase-like glycosyltransferase
VTTSAPSKPGARATGYSARYGSAAKRWLLGGDRDGGPTWARPALLVLLAATALLYLQGLSASGDANSFYAAAVQAGTKSWKAAFFGSFDSASFITVDKPPAALWVMELSGRLFGFNAWSMLVPQALEGVAAVGLLYATVRRWSGPAAGLAAGAALALTPVVVLMFRYNQPDALLTLLLVASAYALTRALERGSARWLMLAGVALGFGFLSKMLQAFLVLPGFAVVYLIAAPAGMWRRVRDLALAGGALVLSVGWWLAAVQLTPASSRPYVGGSTNNSELGLAFGYNGVDRIFGGGAGPGSPGGVGGGKGLPDISGLSGMTGLMGGPTGISRLFGNDMGSQISWLLPAALVALAAGLWLTRRRPRTDRTRAALLLWGTWLVVTGLTFSYMQGINHPYYSVALAPAIAALVAIGVRELWRIRDTWLGRGGLAAMAGLSGIWGTVLLDRDPSWYPELRYALIGVTVVAVAGLLALGRPLRGLAAAGLAAAVPAVLLGSTAYAVDTTVTPHGGAVVTAGPSSAGGGPSTGLSGALGHLPGGLGQLPGGLGGRSGGAGGPAGVEGTANGALVALLKKTTSTWSAAMLGAMSAAPVELASGKAVMAIGGFTGTDPAPTLAQFQRFVAQGKVRYFITGGTFGIGGGTGDDGSRISTWVGAHFTAIKVGGQTVYDLSKPRTGT